MSTFFHVDIAGRLRTGMQIQLAPGLPSFFGKTYLRKFQAVGIFDAPSTLKDVPFRASQLDKSAYRELWLEVVRKNHPEICKLATLSRLHSFFALNSLADAQKFIERSQHKRKASIYEVHSSGPKMKLDMTWLDYNFPRDFRQFSYYFVKYWQGLRIEDDPNLSAQEKRGSLTEVLLGSSVTIGEMVR